MTKIDFSTLAGISFAFALVVISVSMGGDVNKYLNLPSFLIVFGCTFAVSCASYSFREVWQACKAIATLIIIAPASAKEVAILNIKAAEFAYKNGLLGLDQNIDLPLQHRLFRRWLGYVIDGQKIQILDDLITQEIYSIQEQQVTVIQLLRKAAEVAPAYGLIGTLVGLIQMLASINDIANIGQGMSIALLTTFYGAIFAYIILMPLATKFEKNLKEEILNYRIFHKTVISIAQHENPRQLESVLNSILPPGRKVVYYKY